MKVKVTKAALAEFREAKEFYEIEQSGLGNRFAKDIREATHRITLFPEAWPLEKSEIRKCILHKFPYKILYSIQKGEIIILAFAHMHRMPSYWEERIKDL
jgi:hypothetical protein